MPDSGSPKPGAARPGGRAGAEATPLGRARPPGEGLEVADATLRRLDGLVGQLHGALPPHTLLILHTGQARHLLHVLRCNWSACVVCSHRYHRHSMQPFTFGASATHRSSA